MESNCSKHKFNQLGSTANGYWLFKILLATSFILYRGFRLTKAWYEAPVCLQLSVIQSNMVITSKVWVSNF